MGLVIVLLTAPVHGYDLLPDPLGWLLALTGLRALPGPHRSTLLGLAWLAFAVSCALWVPSVPAHLDDVDPSLTWAADLPQLVTTIVLAHALAQHTLVAEDFAARRWLLTARTLLVVVTVLPAIVFGGGLDNLVGATYVAASLALLLLVWLLFAYASRPWAGAQVSPVHR